MTRDKIHSSPPTQIRVRQLFDYSSDTGKLFYRIRYNHSHIGEIVGTNDTSYKRITIDGERFWAHKIIWLWMTGHYPQVPEIIDHIDRNGFNNKWSNLRLVTKIENQWNRKPHKNNSTGYRGVYFNKKAGKFLGQIMVNWQHHYLGLFQTAEEASIAVEKAIKSLRGPQW